MTTTSIKDVGSVTNLAAQAGNVPGKAGNVPGKAGTGGFGAVWSSHADGYKAAPRQKEQISKTGSGQSKPGDDLRAKERSGKYDGVANADAGRTDEMTEDELREAMETVAAAAMQLMQEIADAFGIPVEAVEDIMADMNLQPVDLLQPENLSNLFLEAGGVEDSLALLTDEELYADYRAIMEDGQAALEQNKAALEQSVSVLEENPELTNLVYEADPEVAAKAAGNAEETRDVDSEETVDAASPKVLERADEISQSLDETEETQTVQNARESAQGRDSGRESEGKAHDGNGNLVLQTIRNEEFQPQTESVQAESGAREADAQDIMRQIMDYMRIQVKQDVSSLEMQLHPANLGTLQIQVAAKGGALTANFITQNEAVKAALESQMVQLKESFEEQGVKVEAIEVTVQTHQFEQNLEQGRGRQPQETAEGKRPRTRRIRLDGLAEGNIPEEMQQEDRITAEMMAANGGTVDFTA